MVRAALRALRDRWDPELRRRRAQFGRLNLGLPPDRIALRPGVAFRVDPAARESMEYFAVRSKEMIRELDAFLEATAGCSRLLDIGALHGVFALSFVASRTTGRALAVEPSEEARKILLSNVALNSDCHIRVSASALGRTAGPIRMRRNWQHLEALGDDDSAVEHELVLARTADELCAAEGFEPDVIKIDVEGFEGEVLAGASRLLASRPLVLLELHPPLLSRFGTSALTLIEELRCRGYRVHPIGRRSLPSEQRLLHRNSFRILALPAG